MKTLNHLFEKNQSWAKKMTEKDPEFFSRLSHQQTPKYLWIGCSDSRVSPNQLLDLSPGEVFVHRNIANVVIHTDLNCLSVIQYAVEVLKVEHIIVCGHYGCGGIKASLENQEFGLIDNWIKYIKDVGRTYEMDLAGLREDEKVAKLCEYNVIEQVKNVRNTRILQTALNNGIEIFVHGWIYDLKNGIVKDLNS